MDTVSYLTINDETKEIADVISRHNIEHIAATVAAQGNDIEYIQLETGPNGSIITTMHQIENMAQDAQIGAAAASEAATQADNKATQAGQAAASAQSSASSASAAATSAWNRAGEAANVAANANTQATSAGHAANAAWSHADSASDAASTAWAKAADAEGAALVADHKAELAGEAASAAQTQAIRANTYANGALAGLSTLESVVDTVNWFAEHRVASTDTTVDASKSYYIYDLSTGVTSKVDPIGTENPSNEGWYELDETIQNYVASHIAETDDGLYVLSTAAGWRVLVSTGGGNYVPGVFIVDPSGVIKQAMTGNGISFDGNSPFTIGDVENGTAYIFFDGNGHITLGGSGVVINSGVTIGASNKTLADLLNDAGASIKTIEYGLSSSNISHADVPSWSTTTPQWEAGKYIWMRTTTNGLTYTYTCIQGAQGPQGATGQTGATGASGEQGVGVSSVDIYYGVSQSEEDMPGINDWEDSIDGVSPLSQGSWLWTKTVTHYTDDTSNATYQRSYIGTDGQDAIRIEIDPIGGNFIKRGQVGTSLIAHVYKGATDITNQFSHFTWYRRKADGTRDTSWSTQETSNQLSITTADIDESAVFVCEVTI